MLLPARNCMYCSQVNHFEVTNRNETRHSPEKNVLASWQPPPTCMRDWRSFSIRLNPLPDTSMGTTFGGNLDERAKLSCSGLGSLCRNTGLLSGSSVTVASKDASTASLGDWASRRGLGGTEGETGSSVARWKLSSSEHQSLRASKLAGCGKNEMVSKTLRSIKVFIALDLGYFLN